MQILIELKAVERSQKGSEESEERIAKEELLKLLLNLEQAGYRINSLYAKVIFDIAHKKFVDCGEKGVEVKACKPLVDGIFATGGVMALIDTTLKYIVFDNKYFMAIQLVTYGKARPLTSACVNENFEELVIKENKELLNTLYHEQV